MSAIQWTLNISLLCWVLLRNLGTRPVTRSTFVVPMAVVVIAAAIFLRDIPTAGHDGQLELTGTAVGAVLGIVATAFTRIKVVNGQLVARAGFAFAALWIIVIGGRIAFAEWATHSGARTVGEFSMRHQITGADAWTAAFVLMALAMVLTRVLSTVALTAGLRRRPELVASSA
jgi:hypothetical protein